MATICGVHVVIGAGSGRGRGYLVSEPDGFRDFVMARSPALVRSAWLLTGSEANAQDLVQTALAKTWTRWGRITRQDAPEAYVRRVMLSIYLTWRRRRWRGEVAAGWLPDQADTHDVFAEADVRRSVSEALHSLPRRQRAVVVLRFFDDLTEPQAAAVLGCSVGTVKSQTAKALAKLRECDPLRAVWDEEVTGDTR
jgi:RNA polymerase sigma-70 factor (sigma-E family)